MYLLLHDNLSYRQKSGKEEVENVFKEFPKLSRSLITFSKDNDATRKTSAVALYQFCN